MIVKMENECAFEINPINDSTVMNFRQLKDLVSQDGRDTM